MASNESVERDFGLAAPLRSVVNPKQFTLIVGCKMIRHLTYCAL
jgi:hypothetical protein